LRLQAAAGEVGDVIHFFADDFVEDDADDFDAFFFKKRLVEGDVINGFADAALGNNDDFRAEQFFGDAGIGQVEHGADAGMAAAFAQHKIFFPRDAVEGSLDFFDERIVVGS
jgi:hypothetical protein